MRNGEILTGLSTAATTTRVGRKMEYPEKFLVSFAEGTLSRIAKARAEGEDARALVRQAVLAELKRRERQKP